MSDYFKVRRGSPQPLGATKIADGFNFAVFATHPVTLVIAKADNPDKVVHIPLDPKHHRTGSIWHAFLETAEETLFYGYRINGKLLVDPYARFLASGNTYGKNLWKSNSLLGMTGTPHSFDWEGISNPNISLEKLVIYEMHLRGFTMDPESHAVSRGTYRAVIDKIPYLKELGITACEFLPIMEFDETECPFLHPKTKEHLKNYWGYSPLNFFQPMLRYSSSKDPFYAMNECKEMIKALHKNGIEVILDVVFNHTGEGNENGPTLCYKGFSVENYYLIDSKKQYLNYSGCGNTLNCNNPVVQDLIIDALSSWVTEYHVDGFRFDLASVFARGRSGELISSPPLLERITHNPLFKNVKLIAEPWDAAGLHQLGSFFHTAWKGEQHWLEWNDDYRTVCRKFIRGDSELQGRFATKLCGSSDVYGTDGSPLNSLNFITCHDGFTLRDLVSYSEKHNENNGEENRDGISGNDSSNYGVEGATTIADIESIRLTQVKNFLVTLFISQGVPMLMMGDEYGHTKAGNNNSWCHDSPINWFSWKEIANQPALLQFTKKLIHFRKHHSPFMQKIFLTDKDIIWHGREPLQPTWSDKEHFIAYTLLDHETHHDLFIACNTSKENIHLTLPLVDHPWKRLLDTSLSHPNDFAESPELLSTAEYLLKPHSFLILTL